MPPVPQPDHQSALEARLTRSLGFSARLVGFTAVTRVATGTFEITLTPSPGEIGGTVDRVDFTKIWHGDLQGTGSGVLLSCGDPTAGEAGYVAIETVDGRLGDQTGGFAFQQLASMHAGSHCLRYQVARARDATPWPASPERCS